MKDGVPAVERFAIGVCTGVLLTQVSAQTPSGTLVDKPFRVTEPVEVAASIEASCAPCSWRDAGREAAALRLLVDGRYSQHILLVQGDRPAEYRGLLGVLTAGSHRLSIEYDRHASAPAAGPPIVRGIVLTGHPLDTEDGRALANAPILHARANTIGRFSDVPLVTWYERAASGGTGTQVRYSVIFSNEDGGTPTDRLMATWGRATDIEYIYGATIAPTGDASGAEYQGPDHKILAFHGTRDGSHPLLWVVTDNNMVSDRPPEGSGQKAEGGGRKAEDGERQAVGGARQGEWMRFAPAPMPFELEDKSREAVMDAHPWTYRVMAAEIAREGRVDVDPPAGTGRVADPRRFVYVEACGEPTDATLAFSVATRADATATWYRSDRGLPAFRVARSGCFRVATPLPETVSASDITALRVHAYLRAAERGEPPPRGGRVRLTRVNRLFMLDDDYAPGPDQFSWSGDVTIAAGETHTFSWRSR